MSRSLPTQVRGRLRHHITKDGARSHSCGRLPNYSFNVTTDTALNWRWCLRCSSQSDLQLLRGSSQSVGALPRPRIRSPWRGSRSLPGALPRVAVRVGVFVARQSKSGHDVKGPGIGRTNAGRRRPPSDLPLFHPHMSLPMVARVVLILIVVGGVLGKTTPRTQPGVSPVAGRLSKTMLAGAALSGVVADLKTRTILRFLQRKIFHPQRDADNRWVSSLVVSCITTSRSTEASSAATHTAAYVIYHETLRKTGSQLLSILSGATALIAGHTARFLAHDRFTAWRPPSVCSAAVRPAVSPVDHLLHSVAQ